MPAAAVIRVRLALFVFIGSKGYVGGLSNPIIITSKNVLGITKLEFKRSNNFFWSSVSILEYLKEC